jgi:hypothetical protein
MSLGEIETAVEALTGAEKEELLIFVADRLRSERGALPEPREFSPDEVAKWVAQDEEDMRRFNQTA